MKKLKENKSPRYISITVLSRLENDAPLNLSHREGDLMKHKVMVLKSGDHICIKAKRSGNAVKSSHRRGMMELNGISFAQCNPSTVIGEETQCCTKCKACVVHGYATAALRRQSLIHLTDMVSIEADIVKAFPAETKELANILASLEMAPMEVVKIEQHLTLPPAESVAPMPFRIEKVQGGTHFVNALLLDIPQLPVEKKARLPDEKIAEIYGGKSRRYPDAVKELIKDVINAIPFMYFAGFAMETRNRPLFTPIYALLNSTFTVADSKVPPIVMPSSTICDLESAKKWFEQFKNVQPTEAQVINLIDKEIQDIFKLRDKIQEALETPLKAPRKVA